MRTSYVCFSYAGSLGARPHPNAKAEIDQRAVDVPPLPPACLRGEPALLLLHVALEAADRVAVEWRLARSRAVPPVRKGARRPLSFWACHRWDDGLGGRESGFSLALTESTRGGGGLNPGGRLRRKPFEHLLGLPPL